MKLKPVAARQGAQWVREGFRVFMRRPLAFTGLFAAFLFGALLLLMVPYAGALLLVMSLPLLTLGFMLATRRTLEGGHPTPKLLVAPLSGDRSRRMRLIQLGVVYALASVLLMLAVDWLDGGKFEALQAALADRNMSREALGALLDDAQLQTGMLLRLAFAAALSVPFWHAPALIHWGQQGVGLALFSSTLACWRTKGALLVYALGWALVIGVFGIVLNIVFALLGSPQLMGIAALPAALLFSTVFYASLYFTFRDSFELDSIG